MLFEPEDPLSGKIFFTGFRLFEAEYPQFSIQDQGSHFYYHLIISNLTPPSHQAAFFGTGDN
jgi:hypothetical protein